MTKSKKKVTFSFTVDEELDTVVKDNLECALVAQVEDLPVNVSDLELTVEEES